MPFSLNEFRIDGKVALVTGAGARRASIGRSYCLGLAEAGAEVIVADLNAEGAEAVAEEIRAMGGKATAVQVDIADVGSVQAMAATAREVCGGVDILVNNAALMFEQVIAPATQYPLDEWNRIFAVNVTGALNCAQAIVPMMLERGGGKIVNQISGGAYPPQSVYGITKLALAGLTTTLAANLGRSGINVNGIAPGNTLSEAGTAMVGPDTAFYQHLDRVVTMRAQGQPDELVGTLLLLCSPAGKWIHGQIFHVDGGWIMRP